MPFYKIVNNKPGSSVQASLLMKVFVAGVSDMFKIFFQQPVIREAWWGY